MEPHKQSLQDTEPACYWLDRPGRPTPVSALAGDRECDLAIVGGGFTGLWAALQAKEEAPDREVVLIESDRIGQGASGRNGGFADPSFTHGLLNGQWHFPDEWEELERLGSKNYRGFVEFDRPSLDRRRSPSRRGELLVATEPYQIEELEELYAGSPEIFLRVTLEFLGRDAVRSEVASPTYCAGVWHKAGGIVDPDSPGLGAARSRAAPGSSALRGDSDVARSVASGEPHGGRELRPASCEGPQGGPRHQRLP